MEPGLPSSLPHSATYDIARTISAANCSHQPHIEQTVAIVLPIFGISTAVAVRVYVPLCMVNDVPVLGFWFVIQQLSEFAYLNACDDPTRSESQELLTQLSSWVMAFLPIINDGEIKSTLKLLSFLRFRVLLCSGARGLLCGHSDHGWLISVSGGYLWAQNAEILGQTG